MISSFARGFRVSKRFDSGCSQVGQALDVVAERDHRHPKVGSRLPDRTNQFSTHLSDRRKYMLDPSPHLGDSLITPLLTFGELALGGTPSLNLGSISISLQIGLPRLAGIAPVSVNVRTGVGLIEHSFKMLTFVNSSGIGFDFADQLVAPVRIHRELVAKVTLAMLFRPSGIRILLPAFCGLPVCGDSPLINQCPLIAADMLLWSRNQPRVNDLSVAGQIPLTKQLGIQTIEKGLRSDRTNTILEVPHRRTIRNVGLHRQAAKALKAQPNCSSERLCSRFSARIQTMVSVGNGGRPPLPETTRGATQSTSLANAAKSIWDSIMSASSGHPPRWLIIQVGKRVEWLNYNPAHFPCLRLR